MRTSRVSPDLIERWAPMADALKTAMQAKGLTRVALAAQIHVHPASVYGWLRCSNGPSKTTRRKLAKALGIPETTLLRRGRSRATKVTTEPREQLPALYTEKPTPFRKAAASDRVVLMILPASEMSAVLAKLLSE